MTHRLMFAWLVTMALIAGSSLYVKPTVAG